MQNATRIMPLPSWFRCRKNRIAPRRSRSSEIIFPSAYLRVLRVLRGESFRSLRLPERGRLLQLVHVDVDAEAGPVGDGEHPLLHRQARRRIFVETFEL